MNAPAAPLAAMSALLPGIAAAAAARHDREGSFPQGDLATLRTAGLLALTVPATVGGGGAGLRIAARALEAVGTACPSTALVLAMQYLKHAALARNPAWPDAWRESVQRDAVVKGALINALRVEPEFSSPTRGGTPGPVVERLNRDFNDNLAKPGVEAAMRRFGLKPEAIGPREPGRRVHANHAAIGPALRRLEIA